MGTLMGSYIRYMLRHMPQKLASCTIVSGILRLWVEVSLSGRQTLLDR
jgi:hypothetical protein